MADKTEIAPARQRIARGTRLNEIYEIETLVAVGGMGEVYKGHAIQTGDAVAIKMIRPDLAENEAAIALFRKEASALHELYHEAIVRYYVFSRDPALGCPYLAMEFVDGQSLSERLKQGPLDFASVDLLRRRIAGGLAAAHELGIIHRDLSPDNVILPGGNMARAKIIDFGIARSTKLGEATVIGSGFAGKYNYVSPEQLGLYGGDVGPKSDIYSFALVLAEALLGRPLDMGGSQSAIVEKRRAVPDLAGIDRRIRPLIERMLQPRPDDRPASMADVAAWQPPAEKAPAKGRPLVLAVAAGLVVVAAAAAFVGPQLSQQLFGPERVRESADAPALAPPASAPPRPPPAMQERTAESEPPALVPSGGTPAREPPPAPALPASSQPRAEAVPPVPAMPRQREEVAAGTAGGATAPTVPAATAPVVPPPGPPPPAQVSGAPSLQAPAGSGAKTDVAALPTQPQAVPSIPPEARPVTPSPPTRVDEITRYIDDYSGGDCFFLNPTEVSANTAQIEAYGAATQPFAAFDEAFRQVNGFEAQINLRQVTGAQCPLVTFLRQLGPRRGEPPRLDIAAFSMRSGETLSGTVAGEGDRQVAVLLVSDDGYVHNLSSFIKKSGSELAFNLRIERTSGVSAKPQVVVAFASPQPLATLAGGKALSAATLFPLLFAEIDRTGQKVGVAAKYFRLEE